MGWLRRAAGTAALSVVATAAGLAGAPPAAAAAAQLTRAPYLTDVVGSVATVNWGTDSAGTATVTYGPVAASCTGATASGAATSITVATRAEEQWTAQLTGLAPATAYCYQITQDGVALLTSTPHFTSAVAAGTTGSFSFAVLGDWGEATNGVNTDQQKVLEQVAKSGVQFALGTGDIGYGDASQTDYGDLQNTGGNSEVFRSGFWGEPGGSVPMFTAIGNHGWNDTFLQNWPQPTAVSSSSGAYSLDASGNPQAWYAFDEGTARFYVLEAAAATAGTQYTDDDTLHWTSSSPQVTWLKNDLASHPGTLKVAVFHYPLWSDDASGSDTLLRRDLLPILDQYGVRLAFNGHSHIYERNNAYTSGTVNGLISYVSGGAGADTEDVMQCSAFDAYAIGWATSGSSCHATAPTSAAQVHHFLKVTVNASTVTVAPTDENGNVFDQQTYDFAPAAPTGLTATAGSSHVALSWTAPASDGGSSVSGYTVYRSTSPTAAGTAIASGIATTTYDDTTAAAGTTYYYWVRATNAAGLTGPLSSQASATPYAAPGAPTTVTATPANTAVSLTWTAPPSNGSAISGYTVYRSTTNGSRGGAVGHPTGTSYDDTGLTNGTTYYYTVTATNAAGEGPDSSQASATPDAVPDAPTGLTASPGNGSVSLTWTAPASNGSAISGYTIYRSTTSGVRGNSAGTTTATSFTDIARTNGTTYYYTVTATNAAGEGPGSSEVSATPRTVPEAPTGVSATPGNGSVALTWTAPASNGSAISGYTVYRSTTNGSRGGAVGHPTGTSYDDTGLTNGTTYYYTVTATNAGGEGTDSSQASATPHAVPNAPTGLTASPGNGSVSLTWTAPASNGSAISGYTVYRSTDGSRGSVIGTPTTTAYDDTGLTNGTTYYYTVTATNAAGEGPGAQGSTTPRTKPTAPTSLTATGQNTAVALTWSAPAADGGAAVTGYTVYRSTTSGSRGSSIANPSGTTFTDTGLTNGTTYYYTVTATNTAGEGTGSSEVPATPRTVPDAPTGVSATPGNGSVALTWSVPAANGSAITGYTIYRSTDTTTWTQVGTAATTGFDDGGLANGTTYYYVVTATNAAGESARSATASALPATTPAAPSSLSATAADGHVDLSWTAPSDSGGRAINGYTVYRSTTAGSLGAPISSTSSTSLTDSDVHDGTTYYYAVTASNAVGEGPASAAVSAYPHGGATVTITGRPSSPTPATTATITFTTADPNGLAPTTTCRLDGGSEAACTSGQTFTGLATGSHTVTVAAADGAGPGATASYSWVVDTVTPRVSTDALPVVSVSTATFHWSGSDVGTSVVSYDVRYRLAARDGRFGAWAYPSAWQQTTATSVRYTGIRGFAECFAVRARDAAGNLSGWSPRRCTSVPLDDRALTRHNRWTRSTDPRLYRGTATSTSQTNATLTLTGVGARRLALVVTTCRTCGSVRLYIGGHLVGTMSLHASRTTRRAVLLTPVFARRSGTLLIQVASIGRMVQVDGVAVLP